MKTIKEINEKHDICTHSFYQTNWIDRKKDEYTKECGCGKIKTKKEWIAYIKDLEKIYHKK